MLRVPSGKRSSGRCNIGKLQPLRFGVLGLSERSYLDNELCQKINNLCNREHIGAEIAAARYVERASASGGDAGDKFPCV